MSRVERNSMQAQGQLKRRPRMRPELDQITKNVLPGQNGTSNLQTPHHPQETSPTSQDVHGRGKRTGRSPYSDTKRMAVMQHSSKQQNNHGQDNSKRGSLAAAASSAGKQSSPETEQASMLQRLIKSEIHRRDSKRETNKMQKDHGQLKENGRPRYAKAAGRKEQHLARNPLPVNGMAVSQKVKDNGEPGGRTPSHPSRTPDVAQMKQRKRERMPSGSAQNISPSKGCPEQAARNSGHYAQGQDISRDHLQNEPGRTRAVSDTTLVTRATIHHNGEPAHRASHGSGKSPRPLSSDDADHQYEKIGPRRHSANHEMTINRFRNFFGRKSKSAPSIGDFDNPYENIRPRKGFVEGQGDRGKADMNSVGLPAPPKPPRRFQPLVSRRDRRGAGRFQQKAGGRGSRSRHISGSSTSEDELSGDDLRQKIKQELVMFNNGLRNKVKTTGFGPFGFSFRKAPSSKSNIPPRFDFIQKDEFEKLPNHFRVLDGKRYRMTKDAMSGGDQAGDQAGDLRQRSYRDYSERQDRGLSEEEELFLLPLTGRANVRRDKVLDGPLHMDLPGGNHRQEASHVSTNLMNISKIPADQPVIPKKRMPPQGAHSSRPIPQKRVPQVVSFEKVVPQKAPHERSVPKKKTVMSLTKFGDAPSMQRRSVSSQTVSGRNRGASFRGKFLGRNGPVLSPEEQLLAALEQIQDIRRSYEGSNMNCKSTQTEGAWSDRPGGRPASWPIGQPRTLQRVINGNLLTLSMQDPDVSTESGLKQFAGDESRQGVRLSGSDGNVSSIIVPQTETGIGDSRNLQVPSWGSNFAPSYMRKPAKVHSDDDEEGGNANETAPSADQEHSRDQKSTSRDPSKNGTSNGGLSNCHGLPKENNNEEVEKKDLSEELSGIPEAFMSLFGFQRTTPPPEGPGPVRTPRDTPDGQSLQSAAARSDDASAADSDQAGTLEGIEGEVLDDSQLPTGDTVAMGGDGDLAGSEEYGDSGVGEVEVAFQYSGENRRMNVTIIRCLRLPAKEKGGAGSYRLRLVLFPAKRQRAKTRIRDADKPEFKELFRFSRIYPHELVGTSIRIRLYGAERLRKERLVGEGIVKFSALNVSKKQVIRLRLKPLSELGGDDTPYSSMSDLSAGDTSGSSLTSIQHGGGLAELLAGLSYNSTTGRLAVEVIKGSHFKQLAAGRAPDSYVKVAVMSSSGFEMSKSKSSVRRGQPNPTFKETFIFQIAQFQLNEVTLMFTIFNKKGMKRKNAIGWFSMGLSNTSEEELAHWNEMQTSNGQQVCRWHALLESKS